jgi:disulfide oxidoreductase YuzD
MDWIPKLACNDERGIWNNCTSRRNFQNKVSYVDYSDSKDENNMAGLAESIESKETMSYPFGKKEPERFSFDITKDDKIFDLLLHQRVDQTLSVPYHSFCRRAEDDEVLQMA